VVVSKTRALERPGFLRKSVYFGAPGCATDRWKGDRAASVVTAWAGGAARAQRLGQPSSSSADV